MKTLLNIISFIIIFSSFLKAQGEAVISSLYLTPSVQSAGLGWTGVSFSGNDPFGFYYNPANLGYISKLNNLTIQFYPQKVKWLRRLVDGAEINSFAINLGYNFKKQFGDFNFNAGLGFIHSRFDYGSFFSLLNSEEIYDSYNALSLGFQVDYNINFNFGITLKNVSAHKSLPVPDPFNLSKASADVNAFDYGVLINVPIMRFVDNSYFNISESSRLIPILNYNLGYSRLNIGDEVTYDDPLRTNPLPLTARFGHTINLGFAFESGDFLIDFINYNMIFEADDILLERNDQGGLEYQGLFGDINIGKQFIQLEGDDNVVFHKGHSVNILETLTLLYGSFRGRGYDHRKTDGTIVSSRGIFKLLGFIVGSETFKYIADHIEFNYINSTLFKDHYFETDFSGISISFMNYSFH